MSDVFEKQALRRPGGNDNPEIDDKGPLMTRPATSTLDFRWTVLNYLRNRNAELP